MCVQPRTSNKQVAEVANPSGPYRSQNPQIGKRGCRGRAKKHPFPGALSQEIIHLPYGALSFPDLGDLDSCMGSDR